MGHGGNQEPSERRIEEGPTGRDRIPTVDLTPLVDHITSLDEQVQRLTEASTMWQISAKQAEDQLLQLTAGEYQSETSPDVSTITPESTATSELEVSGISDHGSAGCSAAEGDAKAPAQ